MDLLVKFQLSEEHTVLAIYKYLFKGTNEGKISWVYISNSKILKIRVT